MLTFALGCIVGIALGTRYHAYYQSLYDSWIKSLRDYINKGSK